MKDPHTIATVAALHPKIIPGMTGFINDAEAALDITLRMVQGLRTFAQQQAIYDEGRTTVGPHPTPENPMGERVSNAPPGESFHNYGLAADLCPFNSDGITLNWKYNFKLLVPFAIKYGITWGGLFPSADYDHFENKFSHTWQELLTKYNAGLFISGTNFVDI